MENTQSLNLALYRGTGSTGRVATGQRQRAL